MKSMRKLNASSYLKQFCTGTSTLCARSLVLSDSWFYCFCAFCYRSLRMYISFWTIIGDNTYIFTYFKTPSKNKTKKPTNKQTKHLQDHCHYNINRSTDLLRSYRSLATHNIFLYIKPRTFLENITINQVNFTKCLIFTGFCTVVFMAILTFLTLITS